MFEHIFSLLHRLLEHLQLAVSLLQVLEALFQVGFSLGGGHQFEAELVHCFFLHFQQVHFFTE
jgi:hypothetical protein